ncbi:hypothetical protein CRUP_013907 [Coryphaenoides rupestris]|nr:hypothetical protein CRUP_013907 [Coryphaenoides rupestris]
MEKLHELQGLDNRDPESHVPSLQTVRVLVLLDEPRIQNLCWVWVCEQQPTNGVGLSFSRWVRAVLSWYSDTVSFTTSSTSCTAADSSLATRQFRRSSLDMLAEPYPPGSARLNLVLLSPRVSRPRLSFSRWVRAVLSWYSDTVSFTTSSTSCTAADSSLATRQFRRSSLDMLAEPYPPVTRLPWPRPLELAPGHRAPRGQLQGTLKLEGVDEGAEATGLGVVGEIGHDRVLWHGVWWTSTASTTTSNAAAAAAAASSSTASRVVRGFGLRFDGREHQRAGRVNRSGGQGVVVVHLPRQPATLVVYLCMVLHVAN